MLLALSVAGACRTGGVRPRQAAFPEARSVLTVRPAAEVIASLEAAVRDVGPGVARSAANEGFLETRWFDVVTRQPVAPPFTRLDSIVRIRFYADPVQGKTRLIAECVQRYRYDPSLPDRDLERVVREGHPGRVLLDSLLAPFAADSGGGPPLRPQDGLPRDLRSPGSRPAPASSPVRSRPSSPRSGTPRRG